MIHKLLNNRYEILEKVGEGGMAVVYRAVDQVLKRNVAIKVLKQTFTGDQEFVINFVNEAQSAASLNHPNVVNIFDVCEEEIDGQLIHYIVMEYTEGRTLKEMIDERAPFPDAQIVDIAMQIALALRAAHGNHIIHRDIKPQNIMINRDGEVKVTDFGIAKISTSSTITYTSSILGTVHYISPEQAKGKFIEESSDIYSLGVVMYEMATGKVPFDGENAVAIAIQHIQHDAPDVKDFNPNLSEGLQYIIKKALSKDTADRYQNADALISDLKTYLTLTMQEEEGLDQTTVMRPVPEELIVEKPKESVAKSVYVKEEIEEPAKVEEDHRFRKIILPVLLTLFLIGAGFFVIRGALLSDEPEVTEMNTVEMPNLLGLTLEQANRRGEEEKFTIEVTEERNSASYKAGEIMEQSIAAGERIPEGETVQVVVSLGQELVKVPSILNITQQDAESALNRVGLEVREVRQEYSEEYNEGMVMRQDPEPEVEVPVGTAISITISRGEENKPVTMPDIRGENQYDGMRTLNDLGLSVGQVSSENSDTYAEGQIIRQSVTPGTDVNPQTRIDLVISLGAEETEPPETEPPKTEAPPVETVRYVISFAPPEGRPEGEDNYQVHIVKVDQDVSEDYLNREYAYDAGNQTITIEDTKGLHFELYINGAFIKTVSQQEVTN